MEKLLFNLNGLVPLVVGIVIFILLWVVVFEAFKRTPFIESKTMKAILTTCVSLLSVTAMFQPLGSGEKTYNISERIGNGGGILDAIRFVYAVFGYTVVFIAILFLVSKLMGKVKSNKSLSNAYRKAKTTLQLDPDKSNRTDKKNLEKVQGRKMTRDNTRNTKPIDRLRREHMFQSDIRKETKSNRIK
jgi:Mn2+/Fe2+ NRAMP family transporter